MATIRVSGTRQVTPKGSSSISAPSGKIVLDSSSTFATGNLTVNDDLLVRNDARIIGQVEISIPENDSTQIHVLKDNTANTGNPYGIPYDPGNMYGAPVQRRQAALYVPGGVGIEKDLNVGGFIYGRVETAVTSTNLVISSTNADKVFYPIFADKLSGNFLEGVSLYGDKEGENTGLYYNPYKGLFTVGQVHVEVPLQSTSTTSGALTVAGGVGIQGNLTVDDIYTKVLSSINSKIQIAPDAGLTEVIGDIRVLGDKPVGTAPVVTNVLYVSMDGNDTNDGRAQDPSRACRTIGGALNSPYYGPGTQILVSAGHYLEDNPLRLKPYTSVRGSDIRTTFIEPINKTQDLFHLDSGCYLNYMTFLNGRSGLLEGPYTNDVNRGAYATAFPPLTGNERIDLFQSPYVQNCTNQSGPWLKDGTMFLPNQTVQVPLGVGVGSWPANTTSIVISVIDGEVSLGQHINSGQQNPGFFDARTLLLANKSFLQDQVVSFVDNTFNSGAFVYDTTACIRDIGLIVDSIGLDLLYNSNSESVFAGLQYWEQGGSSIPGEETTTTNAINYAKTLSVGSLAAAGFTAASSVVSARFDDIVGILTNGTVGVTDDIVSNGLPSSNQTTIDAYNTLLADKPVIQDAVIEYINDTLTSPFVLSPSASTKCARDTELIVDAVIQDILFDGDSQSTFAGLQYWAQSVGYVGDISNELTTTTAAINYIKGLASQVVQGIEVTNSYQSTVKQDRTLPASNSAAANVISSKFDLLTDILNNGTSGVTDLIVSNGIDPSLDSDITKAFNLLQANREYLKAEAVAYVDATTTGFIFGATEQRKCSRDTGLIVDAIVQDVMFGGDSQTTFAGLQYWQQNAGYVGNISSELTTTTNAINYVKSLATRIAQNIEVTDGYQSAVTQNRSLPAGSSAASSTVGSLLTTVVNIISNGTTGITDQIVPNGIVSSTVSGVVNAAALLTANVNYVKAETIAYINATKASGFTYNESTCARDVEYILDSVIFDLTYGGNKQSIQSGAYYYQYNTTSVFNLSGFDETPKAIAAYNYMKDLLTNVMSGIEIADVQQYKVKQTVRSINVTAEVLTAISEATGSVDYIIDIIQNGPSSASAKTPIGFNATTDVNVKAALTLLHDNRQFIRDEVNAFVYNTAFGFNFGPVESTKCARDTGLIVDAVVQDMLFSGVSQSTFAGLQYWQQSVGGYTGSIANELTMTVSAIEYLSLLIQNVVQNIEISGYQTKKSPVLSLTPATEVEAIKLANSLSLITDILSNGTDGITDKIEPNSLTASLDDNTNNAYNILIANLDYLKAEVIAFVDATKLPSFGYDSVTCARDVGYIVNSIGFDLLYGGNKQSIQSGVYYYGYNADSVLSNTGTNETRQTLAAYNYLKTLLSNVSRGIAVVSPQQTAVLQVLGTGGTSTEATLAQSKIQVIIDIITNGSQAAGSKTPIDSERTILANVENAASLIYANKDFIKAEVVAYVKAQNNVGYSYDRAKCARDIGFIVDSISVDLLYGGNKQTIQSGVYYYGYSNTSVFTATETNETRQALAAYSYLKSLLPNIIKGVPVSNGYQSVETQVFGATGTIVEATNSTEKIDTIISIIKNGPAGINKLPISVTPLGNTDVKNACNILQANKDYIKAEVIAYVQTLTNFIYDQEKCRRDVGYIIDSVAFDLLHGGNKQSIKSGVYYYNYTNNTVLDNNAESINETPQVLAAYKFIKSLVMNIVTCTPVTKINVLDIDQVFAANYATVFEGAKLGQKIDLITDIIRNGPNPGLLREPIGLVIGDNPLSIDAYNLLQLNKDFIKAEVIEYIKQNFNEFGYAKEYCRRDVGIILENVAYDAAFGGNQKSVEAGLAYFDGVTSKIAGQESQTVSAIDYLNKLCQDVIRNVRVARQTGSNPTIVQSVNTSLKGGELASESIDNLFNVITDIISNGPSVAPAIYTSTGPDAAFVSSEILLQANKQFIQEDTVNYVNWNLTNKQLPYSKIKCKRDIRLIVDAIALDLKYPTTQRSQSTFAGLQYWSQQSYTGQINVEINQTLDAIAYLKTLSAKVMQNITAETDAILGIRRYSNGVQITDYESATATEVATVGGFYEVITQILKNGNAGWTDKIVRNGKPSDLPSVKNAVNSLQSNKEYLAEEIAAYIDYSYPTFGYDRATCKRDVGYMLDSICFDLLHGGNKQTIQAGLSYYGVANPTTIIEGQSVYATSAYNRIKAIVPNILLNEPVIISTGTTVPQVITLPAATQSEVTNVVQSLTTITDIISNGLSVASPLVPIALTPDYSESVGNAYEILQANVPFIVDEVIHYIDSQYNPGAFEYNEELCFRDIGLIVDAVSQDILLGGNQKSIESGLAYWSYGYNQVAGQETTTTMAINYAKNLALEVIANSPVVPQTGTNATQVINTFYKYGGDYMPQEAVRRNFGIISNIIQNGPEYAPPVYAGGGLFALTGLNGSSVNISPTVTSIKALDDGKLLVGLSTATIGFGTNATLYFGDITTYPVQDEKIPAKWASRKVDPIGSMGGSLVDGKVISERSPIQSFVYDAFTQVTQGGRGIHITNDGYAQLVSVFTIFCSVGVQVDNGGIASILNSNNNFGDLCLVAKGFGKRKFTGHIYNPVYKSYPESPVNGDGKDVIADTEELDKYYPNGYWPRGGRVRVYLPDLDDRPHISLIMEVVPPEGHQNEQQLPGFLNASPSRDVIPAGSITITNIDTTGITIGNSLRIRDQFGNEFDANPYLHNADGDPVDAQGNILTNPSEYIVNPDYNTYYVLPDTIVTDIGYRSVTLSKALPNRQFVGEPGNTNYFDLYFSGNAYYTVLSSELGSNPTYNRKNQIVPIGANVLSTASTGWSVSQVEPHADTLRYLQTATNLIINNEDIETLGLKLSTATTQVIDPLVSGGIQSKPFVDLRFDDIVNILTAPNASAAENVIPPRLRVKSGTVPSGAGSAITLIQRNIEFLVDQASTYAKTTYFSTYTDLDQDALDYIESKCKRDVRIILQRIIYDLESGGNYNGVMTGLSYWNRSGSYHIVQMGENVRRPDLFPDGAVVNFYQRSYISASGYVFEYVGAGTNYGALPQVGRADPVQGKETIQISGGKVFFTSTDQNGDFRIGPGLVISQATGVLSGRTFTKSLFANMTPFILAIETGMQ